MQVKQIIPHSVVKIAFNVDFYRRLQTLQLYYIEQKSTEEVKKSIDDIKNGRELDSFTEGLETLLVLIETLEVTFVDEGKVETIEMPSMEKEV